MNEQEFYNLYRAIREEIRNLDENIRPNASSTSPAAIYDSGYEQALDEAVDILDKHFGPLHDKFADQAA